MAHSVPFSPPEHTSAHTIIPVINHQTTPDKLTPVTLNQEKLTYAGNIQEVNDRTPEKICDKINISFLQSISKDFGKFICF